MHVRELPISQRAGARFPPKNSPIGLQHEVVRMGDVSTSGVEWHAHGRHSPVGPPFGSVRRSLRCLIMRAAQNRANTSDNVAMASEAPLHVVFHLRQDGFGGANSAPPALDEGALLGQGEDFRWQLFQRMSQRGSGAAE